MLHHYLYTLLVISSYLICSVHSKSLQNLSIQSITHLLTHTHSAATPSFLIFFIYVFLHIILRYFVSTTLSSRLSSFLRYVSALNISICSTYVQKSSLLIRLLTLFILLICLDAPKVFKPSFFPKFTSSCKSLSSQDYYPYT